MNPPLKTGVYATIIFSVCFLNACRMKEPTSDHRDLGGIVFLKTRQPDQVRDFYVDRVGCTIWLDQGGCFILQHGNLLLGFCDREEVDTSGVFTFFYTSREEVDRMYDKLHDIADDVPRDNHRFRIYHFYATDPEGRLIEFQYFNHSIPNF